MKEQDVAMVTEYVRNCFWKDTPPYLHYHNLAHTEAVVTRVNDIGTFYKLNNEDFFALKVAAWFHDLGYLYGTTASHEYTSISLMADFMRQNHLDAVVQKISEIILATRISSRPGDILCKIIRDADCYHFGTDEFQVTDELVRQEMEEMTKKKFPNWKEHSLFLLKNHRFCTDYCQSRLNAGKKKNILILEEMLRLKKS